MSHDDRGHTLCEIPVLITVLNYQPTAGSQQDGSGNHDSTNFPKPVRPAEERHTRVVIAHFRITRNGTFGDVGGIGNYDRHATRQMGQSIAWICTCARVGNMKLDRR